MSFVSGKVTSVVLSQTPQSDATWMVSVFGGDPGPLAVVVLQPDSEQLCAQIGTRLRSAGVGRISPREWTSMAFRDSMCTAHVTRPPRLLRLSTPRSSFHAIDLSLTERWMNAATGRGRVLVALVPPRSLPDGMLEVDLTADPDALARVERLASDRHLIGALARVVQE